MGNPSNLWFPDQSTPDQWGANRRTVLLYFLGFIYALFSTAFLLWVAGFAFIFYASAEPNLAPSQPLIKPTPSYSTRIYTALKWMCNYDATSGTLRVAERQIWIYFWTYILIAFVQPHHLEDLRGVLVEHVVAQAITLLSALAAVFFWIRGLPRGQRMPQACRSCFERRDRSVLSSGRQR